MPTAEERYRYAISHNLQISALRSHIKMHSIWLCQRRKHPECLGLGKRSHWFACTNFFSTFHWNNMWPRHRPIYQPLFKGREVDRPLARQAATQKVSLQVECWQRFIRGLVRLTERTPRRKIKGFKPTGAFPWEHSSYASNIQDHIC